MTPPPTRPSAKETLYKQRYQAICEYFENFFISKNNQYFHDDMTYAKEGVSTIKFFFSADPTCAELMASLSTLKSEGCGKPENVKTMYELLAAAAEFALNDLMEGKTEAERNERKRAERKRILEYSLAGIDDYPHLQEQATRCVRKFWVIEGDGESGWTEQDLKDE
ncbi:hypothetical protein CC80DRAFT_503901 [Byssothecium circinans]|uniref:Uncharacterized protein n=1 Tax=Byssothecium circinans TaxID=147558 RepID=A0A6A5TY74_9PLEO|nr:hypothetical protein CC80DRAFT_503901 [Byssothecium circinans]